MSSWKKGKDQKTACLQSLYIVVHLCCILIPMKIQKIIKRYKKKVGYVTVCMSFSLNARWWWPWRKALIGWLVPDAYIWLWVMIPLIRLFLYDDRNPPCELNNVCALAKRTLGWRCRISKMHLSPQWLRLIFVLRWWFWCCWFIVNWCSHCGGSLFHI